MTDGLSLKEQIALVEIAREAYKRWSEEFVFDYSIEKMSEKGDEWAKIILDAENKLQIGKKENN